MGDESVCIYDNSKKKYRKQMQQALGQFRDVLTLTKWKDP